MYACGKTYQDDTAFNDKITLLENHPEAILAQPDSTDFSRITTEKEATAFLLRSLARHYTSRDFYPENEEIAAIEQGMKLAELADDPVWKSISTIT